jgi:hypothetical protein
MHHQPLSMVFLCFFDRVTSWREGVRHTSTKRETTVSEHALSGLRAVWYSQIGYSKTQTTSYSYRVRW